MNFWKTARDPFSPLVAPLSESFGRLGALVFQPDATEKSYWANALLGIQTRIAGSAAAFTAVLTRGGKNVFPTSFPGHGNIWNHQQAAARPEPLSFARWDKVESHPSKKQAGAQPAWLSPLNFDNHGAQVALPQSPILRDCTVLLTKLNDAKNEKVLTPA
jgi:hypothetical protein